MLQHPDALDDERVLQVSDSASSVDIDLWRRRPDVVAIRPVYPGSSFLDARFVSDGQVALLVGLPSPSGALSAMRELWLLAPATGRLARLGSATGREKREREQRGPRARAPRPAVSGDPGHGGLIGLLPARL
jgi:hypothetical protein